jgi:hypothetical protein
MRANSPGGCPLLGRALADREPVEDALVEVDVGMAGRGLTAYVIAVKLFDFYIRDDDQNKRLNDRVVGMWNWLDEAKRVPLLEMAHTLQSKRILFSMEKYSIISNILYHYALRSDYSEIHRHDMAYLSRESIWKTKLRCLNAILRNINVTNRFYHDNMAWKNESFDDLAGQDGV